MNKQLVINLENITNKNRLVMSIKYGDVKYDYILSMFLNKHNPKDLHVKQYILLEEYLNSKGQQFIEKYLDALKTYEQFLDNSIYSDELFVLPQKQIHNILNLFDYNDVLEFAKKSVLVPEDIIDEFDMDKEKEGTMTKEQTYIKSEYVELAAFSIIVKTVIGPLAKLAKIEQNKLSANYYLDSTIFETISTHKVSKIPAIVKLAAFIKAALGDIPENDLKTKIINLGISEDDINDMLKATLVMRVVSFASIRYDSRNSHMINRAFKKILEFKKPVTGAKSITPKSASIKDDETSVLDSHRRTYLLTVGDVKVIEWSISSMSDLIVRDIYKIPLEDTMAIRRLLEDMDDLYICHDKITLVAMCTYDLVHPNAVDYIGAFDVDENGNITVLLKNLFAMAISRLNSFGLDVLSNWLLSRPVIETDALITNTVLNSKFDNDIVEQIKLLGIEPPTTNAKKEAMMVTTIHELAKKIHAETWTSPTMPDLNARLRTEGLKNMLGTLTLILNDVYDKGE